MEHLSRREIFRLGVAILLLDGVEPLRFLNADSIKGKDKVGGDKLTESLARIRSNFHWFYSDPRKALEFEPFLENVFHLYPPDRFQALIRKATLRFSKDPEIYAEVVRGLPKIKPFLSDLTYALPALRVQKAELKKQSLEALGESRRVNGYLEVGAPGRYISTLRDGLELSGPIFIFHDSEPSFSPNDVLERGQLAKLGNYIPLGNYNFLQPSQVPDESLDLITCFIGFHHCPADKKKEFILSLKRTLRKGGNLLLRDHNVTDENMDVLVGLAHDVFNAGLMIPWNETARQIRNFQSVETIQAELAALGLKREGPILYQKGDPTRNAVMRFVRVS